MTVHFDWSFLYMSYLLYKYGWPIDVDTVPIRISIQLSFIYSRCFVQLETLAESYNFYDFEFILIRGTLLRSNALSSKGSQTIILIIVISPINVTTFCFCSVS